MNVNLYIKGREADIGDKKTFARSFKKTMSFCDLENPTKITTDFSYSITLPGTDNNREIFGWIDQGTQPAYWNPNAAYPYSLNVNGILFSEGNVQLTEMKVSSGRVEFSCTFYSKVHSMIMDMSQKPLKDLTILKADDGYMHFLDINMMDRIWAGYEQICDILRYVPTRAGMYPNFTSSKMMTPKWNANEPPSVDGYNAIDLGTDYDEYATREYRLQYQRPAVSMDKLMKGLASDFSISIDTSVMASPYVKNSWMMCPSMSIEDKTTDCRGTAAQQSKSGSSTAPPVSIPSSYPNVFSYNGSLINMSQTTALPSGIQIISPTAVTPAENCLQVTFEFCVRVDFDFTGAGVPASTQTLMCRYLNGPGHFLTGTIDMELSGSGHTVSSLGGNYFSQYWAHCYLNRLSGNKWRLRGHDNEAINVPDTWEDLTLLPCRVTFSLDHSVENVALTPRLLIYDWAKYDYEANNTFSEFDATSMEVTIVPMEALTAQQLNILRNNGYNGYTISYTSSVSGSSPMYVNMDTVFGNQELSCKDFLTDVTKMLGCIWEFDSNGNLSIENRNKYFDGYQVYDWTKKMDRRNITIKPLAFDKREYTMSYKSGGSVLEDNYKDLTGYDWGKQYVDTGYPFNDQTESLLETKFLNTVQCKGERTVIHANYNYNNQEYKLSYMAQTPYEIPMIEKKDNGAPEEGFRLLFNNGVTTLEKGEYVYLTQDSSWMHLNNEIGGKCWMDLEFANNSSVGAISSNTMQMDRIPFFCTRQNLASWDFAKSSLSYSMENDLTYPAEICLYPRFWRDYMSALYNAKTRVLTADFALSVEDLITFSFRNFVMIDNHLWHPNKLIDFDLSGETLTKVELIEVNDIDAWTQGQNWDFKNPPMGYPIHSGDRGESYWENYVEEEPKEENEQEE